MKIQDIGVIVTIGLTIASGIAGYTTLKVEAKETAEETKDNTKEIKGVKEEINEVQADLKVVQTNQSNLNRQVQDLHTKSDKIYDLLIEMKND